MGAVLSDQVEPRWDWTTRGIARGHPHPALMALSDFGSVVDLVAGLIDTSGPAGSAMVTV